MFCLNKKRNTTVVEQNFFRNTPRCPSFVDGLYHTRDLGYIGEDGNLYVSGRMDDMIKINGNRVEPGEIEVVIRREFGVENVVVKGFQEKDRSFLAAFFLKSESETKNILLTPEDFRNSLFEFNISKQYSTGNFVCEAEYSANRYSKERMERFMDDYANKLKLLLLAGPETKVQDILKDCGQPA